MYAHSSPHPTAETLEAYGAGKLDDVLAEAVAGHLEDCPECRRRVAEMAPDTFLGRLRDAGVRPEAFASDRRSTPHGPAMEPGRTVADPAAATDPSVPDPGVAALPTVGLASRPSGPRSGSGASDEPTRDPLATGESPVVSETANNAAEDGQDEAAFPAGTRIGYFGDYELQRVLGEGGMGIVYKARQLSLNRSVALKMIRAARFASADEVRRFQNEAEAVARLDHPHIVPIFEVGRYEDQHYFSMKLIAGESLDKWLKDYVADSRSAARLVATTADAIHHAHQRGILHRDLKPANILVDSDGQPHVTDFGLAKRVEGDSELTRSGAIIGTPAYMAPEQASGTRGVVTTSTDVYGLGAILYALLTGRAPFGGTAVIDTLEQVRERAPESPRKLNPRAPRDLEVICLKCLEKDSRRRYASADALAEDLRRWLAGEPTAARAVGVVERACLWARRYPTAAALAGVSLVAMIAMIAAGFFIAYNGELKRANRAIEEARGKIEAAYASESAARRRAEAAEDEFRNALDLANCSLDVMQITSRSLGQGRLSVGFPAADEPDFKGQLLLSFPAANSPEFDEAIAQNQGIAERTAYYIEEAMGAIRSGVKARSRVTGGRWQGYYDTIRGRLLAMKVRCYEYNWACARMKRDPPRFTNPEHNAWRLVPDTNILYSKIATAAAREAEALLRRVVAEHPGTPWAMMAQRELKDPFGFKWVETYVNPAVHETRTPGGARTSLPSHSRKALLSFATRLARQGYRERALEELDRVGDPTPGTADEFEVLQQRGDLFALLGLWDRAVADYNESVRLRPEDRWTRHRRILALLAVGERRAAQQAAFDLPDRFRREAIPIVAMDVARCLVLAPGEVANQEASVRLAAVALKGLAGGLNHAALDTLGAALYRAGRFEEAIRRLEEANMARPGAEEPLDWPFLAMAHHRLGHHEEALRWLDRLRNRQPSTDPGQFWKEVEVRLLGSEAEAVIVYDPGFPSDPLVH